VDNEAGLNGVDGTGDNDIACSGCYSLVVGFGLVLVNGLAVDEELLGVKFEEFSFGHGA
jgi:hypothetical protein